MPKRLLTDSGYWIALFDEGDEFHDLALAFEDELNNYEMVVPWPILYETLKTPGTVKSMGASSSSCMKGATLLDNKAYRSSSLERLLESQMRDRAFSLVDQVVREVLADVNVAINVLITFNPKDFYDVCASRDIQIPYRD